MYRIVSQAVVSPVTTHLVDPCVFVYYGISVLCASLWWCKPVIHFGWFILQFVWTLWKVVDMLMLCYKVYPRDNGQAGYVRKRFHLAHEWTPRAYLYWILCDALKLFLWTFLDQIMRLKLPEFLFHSKRKKSNVDAPNSEPSCYLHRMLHYDCSLRRALIPGIVNSNSIQCVNYSATL